MATNYTGSNQRVINYLAKHPNATVSEARGHGYTPEHGYTQRGGTVEVYRGADAAKVIAQVARQDEARRAAAVARGEAPPAYRRVVVTTFEQGGGRKTYGVNPKHGRGMSSKYAAGELGKAKTFRRGMANAQHGVNYKLRRGGVVERVQIDIVER